MAFFIFGTLTMTERETSALMLQMLGDLKTEQAAQRKSIHDLRDELHAANIATVTYRADIKHRVENLERRRTEPCSTCAVGSATVAVQKRGRRAQAGYVSVGVIAFAAVIKAVEFVGMEVVHSLSKSVTK